MLFPFLDGVRDFHKMLIHLLFYFQNSLLMTDDITGTIRSVDSIEENQLMIMCNIMLHIYTYIYI